MKLMESAVSNPLVLVVAGAGYGKTRAVHSFLRNYDALTTWVQLSERDNIGLRFWENFIHTVSLYNDDVAARLEECGFPDTDEKFARFVTIPEDKISSSGRYVMVFDDFHLISDRSVLRFIEMSVNMLFPNFTTIIISRTEPDINAIGLLSKGYVVRISEDELRFTEKETDEYLGTLGINLSAQSSAAVYEDTGGWAFAVSLMGLSLQKDKGYESYSRSAMKLNIFKLIEHEVFLHMSERLRRFMIRVSLIDHLSSELIRILAHDDSLVEEMTGLNSFVRYDAYLDAYLIHHLFLAFLRQKRDSLTDDERRDTYVKAAQWCEMNDYKFDAITYYERAGNYNAIINIISNVSVAAPRDLAKFALGIYENSPREHLVEHAKFHTHHIRLLISLGRLDEALAEANDKVRCFADLPPNEYNNRVLCGAYRAICLIGWLALPSTDRCDFDVSMERSNHYYKLSPFTMNAVMNSCHVGPWASMVGTPRAGAMEEYINALERMVPYSVNAFNGSMYGLDDLARGELFFFRGDLKNAAKFAAIAYHKAIELGQYEVRNRAVFYMLRIRVAQGDMSGIRTALENLSAQLEIHEYYYRYPTYDIATSWYYSLLGVPRHTAAWLGENFAETSFDSLLADFAKLVKAKMLCALGRYHELLSFIGLGHAPNSVLFGRVEIKAMEAVALYQTDERKSAFAALEEAYETAYTNELVMPFIELGKEMRSLVSAASKSDDCKIPGKWLDLIGGKSAAYARKVAFVISEYRKENNLDEAVKLSRRETEVLSDLYQGFSRSEIAANRNLSINTVKSVLNMVYAKLGADNVADAIRLALEKNLI
jgi:LuxR family maltose regulon positive regulatory protein